MKELRNRFDKETTFEDLAKAKKYYTPNLSEFPDEAEYAAEIAEAETLEDLADVLNKYTDEFGNGTEYYVYEF